MSFSLFVLMMYNVSSLPLSHVHNCYSLLSSKLLYFWHFWLRIYLFAYDLRWELRFMEKELSHHYWNSIFPHYPQSHFCPINMVCFLALYTAPPSWFYLRNILVLGLSSFSISFRIWQFNLSKSEISKQNLVSFNGLTWGQLVKIFASSKPRTWYISLIIYVFSVYLNI